jgi:hypothetical protein
MAGFEVTPYGRFCLTPEAARLTPLRAKGALPFLREQDAHRETVLATNRVALTDRS